MDQDRVARSILGELVELGVVREQEEDIAFEYLYCAYAAGFDEGRMQAAHRRPVLQVDMATGRAIKRYDSALIAARKVGLTKHSISKAALGKTRHAGGFYWEYIDGKNDDSSKSPGTKG